MKNEQKTMRSAVRRDRGETYVLISLVAFAATVIVTRVFLELAGYPQIGNSVLHIAHALWGGLLLIMAAYLPLGYANRWAFQASALLGGVGVGLFIDEVGKFITQANDYFFPPALPLIYGFVLLNVLVYRFFRRRPEENSRVAMYHVFDGLGDLLDGDLNAEDAAGIMAHLAIARRSGRAEIASLAELLSDYLTEESAHLPAAKPGLWKQAAQWMTAVGKRVGRPSHRILIASVLIGWAVLAGAYVAVIAQGTPGIDPQVLGWRVPLIVVQVVVGVLMAAAAVLWLARREELGLRFGVSGFLVSLVALQLLYFYLSQFSAITATLLQMGFLWILLAYRRWYLRD
jgi:hypothetical protein